MNNFNVYRVLKTFFMIITTIMLISCGGGSSSAGSSQNSGLSSNKEIRLMFFTDTQQNVYPVQIINSELRVSIPVNLARSVVASFVIDGARLEANQVLQTSGVTSVDLTREVFYEVFAFDGSSKRYSLVNQNSSDRSILSFSLISNSNKVYIGNIVGNSIVLNIPFDETSAMRARFTLSPGAIAKVRDIPQVSDVTVNDFSGESVVYVIHASDGSIESYNITVVSSSARSIDNFVLIGHQAAYAGTIQDGVIRVEVPFDDTESMVSVFTLSDGASATVNNIRQISGVTVNNFRLPVTYVVRASDGSSESYQVEILQSSNNQLLAFLFVGANQAAYTTTINESIVVSNVGFYDSESVTPIFTLSQGAYATVNGVRQVSGFGSYNLNNGPIDFTVHATDGSTKVYTITNIQSANNSINSMNLIVGNTIFPAVISGNNITIDLPFYALGILPIFASIDTAGMIIELNGQRQQPIHQITIDYATPLVYSIYASNGNIADYTITLNRPNPGSLRVADTIDTGRFPLSMAITPDNQYAYVIASVGNPDARLLAYRIESFSGTLNLISNQPSIEPFGESMFISPDSRHMYLFQNNLQSQPQIAIFDINSNNGVISNSGLVVNGTFINMVFDANGDFAYLANKGTHSIDKYLVNKQTGGLLFESSIAIPFSSANGPRLMVLSPNDRYLYQTLASQASILIYQVSPQLSFVGTVSTDTVPRSLAISGSGLNLYVATTAKLNQYITQNDGGLSLESSISFFGASSKGIVVSNDGKYIYHLVDGNLASIIYPFELDEFDRMVSLPGASLGYILPRLAVNIYKRPDGRIIYVPHVEPGSLSVFQLN